MEFRNCVFHSESVFWFRTSI